MRLRTLARLLGCVAALLPAAPSLAALLNPIATTGHDQDVVVEAGLNVGDPAIVGEMGSRQFYEQGLSTQQPPGPPTNHKPGLTQNVTGFISSLTGNTINYDFQPFEQNNILKFDAAAMAKTLTLTSPNAYRHLAVVATGGSLASSETAIMPYTINYAGGETQSGTINLADWGNVPPPAGAERLLSVGRINMSSGGAATTWNNQVPEGDTTANRWTIYVSEITPTRTDLNIESISFGPASLNAIGTPLNSGDDVAVFGLAGAVIPEPAALALAALAALGLAAARRRRN